MGCLNTIIAPLWGDDVMHSALGATPTLALPRSVLRARLHGVAATLGVRHILVLARLELAASRIELGTVFLTGWGAMVFGVIRLLGC